MTRGKMCKKKKNPRKSRKWATFLHTITSKQRIHVLDKNTKQFLFVFVAVWIIVAFSVSRTCFVLKLMQRISVAITHDLSTWESRRWSQQLLALATPRPSVRYGTERPKFLGVYTKTEGRVVMVAEGIWFISERSWVVSFRGGVDD